MSETNVGCNDLLGGEYVLAMKYNDGDPADHWAVGFFSRMLPKASGARFMVVDGNGNQFRGNGFRRVEKISKARGEWLLNNRDSIENGGRSLLWWLRQPMTPNDKDMAPAEGGSQRPEGAT